MSQRGFFVAYKTLGPLALGLMLICVGRGQVLSASRVSREEDPILDFTPQQPRVVESQSSGVFHGRLRTRFLGQNLSDGTHMTRSRLESDGAWERMGGSRLSLFWSGNASTRDGNTVSSAPDFRQVQLNIFKFAVIQKTKNGGFNKLGRFIPAELPLMGYVDGFHWQLPAGSHLAFGNMLGTRPDRINLEWSKNEPVVSGYGAYESGKRNQLYFKGTVGVMQTLWEGKSDELALFVNEQADLSSKLNIFGLAQVDFKTPSNRVYSETRLKRLNVYANAPIWRLLTFRAGTDFYERPDTQAERHITGENNLDSFRDSTWRHTAGSSQYLFWNLRLDEDFTYIQTSSSPIPSQKLWRYSLTRSGFWFSDQASLTASVFDLNLVEGKGYGAVLYGFFPFLSNRLTLDASTGYQYAPQDLGEKKEWNSTDWSTHVVAHITNHWDIHAGGGQTFYGSRHSTTLDGGVTYRW